jgi:hypothetical protein
MRTQSPPAPANSGISARRLRLLTFIGSVFGGGATGPARSGLAYGRRGWTGANIA